MPDQPESYNNLGNLYGDRGEFTRAVSMYEKALARQPDEVASVLENLADTYLDMGDPREARRVFEQCLDVDPVNAGAHLGIGTIHRGAGDLVAAVASFERAIKSGPEFNRAWVELAEVLAELGRHDEAAPLFSRALERDPEYSRAWYGLAASEERLGHGEEAVEAYTSFLRVWPHRSGRYRQAMQRLEQLQSSLQELRRALAAKFESADAADNMARLLRRFGELGRGLMESGQLKQVESVSRQLLETNPRHRDSLFFLGVSLFHQGLVGESGEVNRYLVESHPDFIEGYIQLGNLYETLGELEGAAAVYEEAYRRVRDRDLRELLGQRLSGVRGRLVQ